MVFFFGCGWVGGSPDQVRPHAQYFSSRGLVCFLVDYRVRKRQGTTPFEALNDAKSTMRKVKAHAERFHFDTNRIIAAGGTAGVLMAASSGSIAWVKEKMDSLSDNLIRIGYDR